MASGLHVASIGRPKVTFNLKEGFVKDITMTSLTRYYKYLFTKNKHLYQIIFTHLQEPIKTPN